MTPITDVPARLEGLDPEALAQITAAYDQATKVLYAKSVPYPADLLALRILSFAGCGVRDRDRLCRLALTGLVVRKG